MNNWEHNAFDLLSYPTSIFKTNIMPVPPLKLCFMVDEDLDDQKIFSIALEEVGNEVNCVFAHD